MSFGDIMKYFIYRMPTLLYFSHTEFVYKNQRAPYVYKKDRHRQRCLSLSVSLLYVYRDISLMSFLFFSGMSPFTG